MNSTSLPLRWDRLDYHTQIVVQAQRATGSAWECSLYGNWGWGWPLNGCVAHELWDPECRVVYKESVCGQPRQHDQITAL